MASRSLYEHATADATLARFHAQAQRLLGLQRFLESALPPPLRRHARVANMRAGKLVVYASNAAVAEVTSGKRSSGGRTVTARPHPSSAAT